MAVRQPGRYNQLIRIERPSTTRNEYGEESVSEFVLVGEVWAEVILPSTQAIDRARESALASRTVVERIVHFAMRSPVDIAAKDRIIWNDEPYGVEGNVQNPKGGEIVVTGRFVSGTSGA